MDWIELNERFCSHTEIHLEQSPLQCLIHTKSFDIVCQNVVFWRNRNMFLSRYRNSDVVEAYLEECVETLFFQNLVSQNLKLLTGKLFRFDLMKGYTEMNILILKL